MKGEDIYTNDVRGIYLARLRPRGTTFGQDFTVNANPFRELLIAATPTKVLEADIRRASLEIVNDTGAILYYGFGEAITDLTGFAIAAGVSKTFQTPIPCDALWLYSVAGGNAKVNYGRR